MSTQATFQTRDQRIVAACQRWLDDDGDPQPLRARARDLPAMLRRHGLLQLLHYLAMKGKSDGAEQPEKSDLRLARFLCRGIQAALPQDSALTSEASTEPTKYAAALAAMDAIAYLRHQEAAATAAAWVKLLIEGRTAPAGPTDDEGGDDGSA